MMDCSTDLRYFAIRANTPKKILQSRNKKCQDHKVTNHGRPDRRYGLVRSGFLTRNFIWSGTRSGFWSATFFRTEFRTTYWTEKIRTNQSRTKYPDHVGSVFGTVRPSMVCFVLRKVELSLSQNTV